MKLSTKQSLAGETEGLLLCLKMALCFETTGARQLLSSSEDFKINFYFPVLDTFFSEFSTAYITQDLNIFYVC